MKRAILPCIALLLACASDSSTGPTTSLTDLIGTWEITRWELASAANPSLIRDLLAEGREGTLTIARGGNFVATVYVPGWPPSIEEGTITLKDSDTLIYDGENDELEFTFTVTHDTMTWVADELELNDVDGDGQPEDTRETIVFRRT